jgi:hypothetical protein
MIGNSARANFDRSGVFAAVVAVAIGGCGGTTEIITPPPPPPAAFVLQFVADPEDAGTAQGLGWQNGIPEVELTLRPEDTTKGGVQTHRGNGQGAVSLSGLTPGRYLAAASRWLTAAERARLPITDAANGFLARGVVDVAGSGIGSIAMVASRQRSLIISEWAFNSQRATDGAGYGFGGFLELYNNADTTVYLDGMILAEGFNRDYDFPLSGCAENSPYTNDPDGVWTRFFQRFPGSGRTYPLPPRQTAVVATDAIDHRPLSRVGVDLRNAAFESAGHLDADNPAVPNLVEVGLTVHESGHGLTFRGTSVVTILAAAGDPATFARARFAEADYLRIPRTLILDVLWVESPWDVGVPPCPRLVNPAFDRQGSRDRGTDEIAASQVSLSRLPSLAAGLGGTTLRHTRTGALDFTQTARSLGVVP